MRVTPTSLLSNENLMKTTGLARNQAGAADLRMYVMRDA